MSLGGDTVSCLLRGKEKYIKSMCNFCCVSVAASETETHECRLQSVNKMERVGGEDGRWGAGGGGVQR